MKLHTATYYLDRNSRSYNVMVQHKTQNIYLGLQENGNLPNEPAILGNQTQEWLNDLLTLIDDILDDILFKVAFVSTAPGVPTAPNPANFNALQLRKNEIQRLSNTLEQLKSKNTKLV